MKEILKELKNAFALGWYKFRKALEWIDSKIPEGSGNNSDERFIGMEECEKRDFNGTCSELCNVYSDKFIQFMKTSATNPVKSNPESLKELEEKGR